MLCSNGDNAMEGGAAKGEEGAKAGVAAEVEGRGEV
jgi:hypothetical protein